MKKLFLFLLTMILIGLTFYFKDDIVKMITDYVFSKPEIIIQERNEYYNAYNYAFVESIDDEDFIASSYDEIVNIFYTTINSGWDNFTFYCDEDYQECLSDVNRVANDSTLLNQLNNYVHPFNSYEFIQTTSSNYGRISIFVFKLYSTNDVTIIEDAVDKIYNKLIKENMTSRDKIKAIHDYIINNTVYDNDFLPNVDSNQYKSNTAYGVLLQNKGICGGYTDTMAIFLNKMGIPNYKISSNTHIWNFLYLDGKWYHLDLTWDDPVVSDGSNRLEHKFFLITSQQLEKINTKQHVYDKEVYIEAK